MRVFKLKQNQVMQIKLVDQEEIFVTARGYGNDIILVLDGANKKSRQIVVFRWNDSMREMLDFFLRDFAARFKKNEVALFMGEDADEKVINKLSKRKDKLNGKAKSYHVGGYEDIQLELDTSKALDWSENFGKTNKKPGKQVTLEKNYLTDVWELNVIKNAIVTDDNKTKCLKHFSKKENNLKDSIKNKIYKKWKSLRP